MFLHHTPGFTDKEKSHLRTAFLAGWLHGVTDKKFPECKVLDTLSIKMEATESDILECPVADFATRWVVYSTNTWKETEKMYKRTIAGLESKATSLDTEPGAFSERS